MLRLVLWAVLGVLGYRFFKKAADAWQAGKAVREAEKKRAVEAEFEVQEDER